MIKLDGVESADVNVIAAKLAYINAHTNTFGNHYQIGTLYGFKLTVKTENSDKIILIKDNKFYVEGEGNIKHTYNNGNIANDPKLAVNYFLNALEKIPSLIAKYQTETEKLTSDLPVLQEVVNSTWRKENELKDLKTELSALDRKIQLSLKPIDQSDEKPTETQEVKLLEVEYSEAKIVAVGNSPFEERIQQAKGTLGDRLIIASIPKYHHENQSKTIKL